MSKAHSAAKRGDAQTLNRLVADPEFDCFFRDPIGNTVLHVAALHGNLAAVQVVLRQCKQLDPNLPNYEGKTAVDLAKANRHIDVVEALFRNISMMDTMSQALVVDTISCQAINRHLSYPHEQNPYQGFEETSHTLDCSISSPRAGNKLQQKDLEFFFASTRDIPVHDKLELELDYYKDCQINLDALHAGKKDMRTKLDEERNATICAILDFKEQARKTAQELRGTLVEIFNISLKEISGEENCDKFQTRLGRSKEKSLLQDVPSSGEIHTCAHPSPADDKIKQFSQQQLQAIDDQNEVLHYIMDQSFEKTEDLLHRVKQVRDFEVSLACSHDNIEQARHQLIDNSENLLVSATTLRRLKAEINSLAHKITNQATQLKRLEQERSAIVVLTKESACLAHILRANQDEKVARIEHLENNVQTSRNILADVTRKAEENEKRLNAKLTSSKEAQLYDIESKNKAILDLEAGLNATDEVEVKKIKKELDLVEAMHENELILFEDRMRAAAQREQDALAREHAALLQADDIISKYQSLDIIKQLENVEMELRMTKDELAAARYKHVELMAKVTKLDNTTLAPA